MQELSFIPITEKVKKIIIGNTEITQMTETITICPNCRTKAINLGNKIACTKCGQINEKQKPEHNLSNLNLIIKTNDNTIIPFFPTNAMDILHQIETSSELTQVELTKQEKETIQAIYIKTELNLNETNAKTTLNELANYLIELELITEKNLIYEIEEEDKKITEIANKIMQRYCFLTTKDNTETLYHYQPKKGNFNEEGARAIIKELVKCYAGEKVKRNFAEEIIHYIQISTYIEREKLNAEKTKINTLNGVLDTKTKEFTPHSPIYAFTTCLPIKYQPNSTCSKIIKFLREILANEEDVMLMQEFFGFILQKGYQQKRALLLYGEGDNGKTTLIDLITKFIGEENISNVALQSLSDKFTTKNLDGKLANIRDDLSDSALEETGLFKQATGQSPLQASVKFKNDIQFFNSAKMIFACNRLPKSPDDSDAFAGRWILMNFPNQFTDEKGNKKPNLLNELTSEEELSGLLNWALIGLERLEKNGKFTGDKTTAEKRDIYKKKSDPLLAFLEDCIEYTGNIDDFILKDLLFNQLAIYCKENKLKIVSKDMVGKNIQKYISVYPMNKTVNGIRQHCWCGICFKDKVGKISEIEGEMDGVDKVVVDNINTKKDKVDKQDRLSLFFKGVLGKNVEYKKAKSLSSLNRLNTDAIVNSNQIDENGLKTEFGQSEQSFSKTNLEIFSKTAVQLEQVVLFLSKISEFGDVEIEKNSLAEDSEIKTLIDVCLQQGLLAEIKHNVFRVTDLGKLLLKKGESEDNDEL